MQCCSTSMYALIAHEHVLEPPVLSPHSHCRFELLALLGNTTEKKCSNLLIGVENTAGDVCCEEQCGTCGGSGCGQRPGGSVRWCLDIFVSCPLVSRAFGESRSFGCPGPWKRGKCSRHRSRNQTFGYRFAGKRALLTPPPTSASLTST